MRDTTTSNEPSSNGMCSAGASTSARMPGDGSSVTTCAPCSRSRRATWPPPVATSRILTPACGLQSSTTASRSSPLACVALVRYASARSSHTLLMPSPRGRTFPANNADACAGDPRMLRTAPTSVASCRELHSALRGVEHRRLDVEVRRRRVGEDLAPLLRVRAVESDDDRDVDLDAVERLEDAARDLVAARDPAED